MSLFFLTNLSKKINSVVDRIEKIFERRPSVGELTDDHKIIFFEDKVFRKNIRNGQIYAFGLFFNERGFLGEALEQVECHESLEKTLKEGLFGHYVFVVVTDGRINIVADKVGMLNVFYYQNAENLCVSTDLQLIGESMPGIKPSSQGVKEFIFNESTIGSRTVFENVKRLRFGKAISIANDLVLEKKYYNYVFENLSFEEYVHRVEKYFTLLNKYDGRMTTDLSGGFDTRLVAAVAHKAIRKIEANSNSNQFDGGVDDFLSPIVARKLKLKLTKLRNKDACDDRQKMLHYFSVGRDIIRSRFWPSRLETKYKLFDLSLGGYGGETIRAKYNDLSTDDLYSSSEAFKVLNDQEYHVLVNAELNESYDFQMPLQWANFVYTVDRMRVWGGAQVYANFLYGQTLHPFMDWHLINPIFSFDAGTLKGGGFQKELIRTFAPQVDNVPINSKNRVRYKIDLIKKWLKEKIKKSNSLHAVAKRIKMSSLNDEAERKKIYAQYPRIKIDTVFFEKMGIKLSDVEERGRPDVLSRLITINEAFSHFDKEEK
jgi:hypothetical protein